MKKRTAKLLMGMAAVYTALAAGVSAAAEETQNAVLLETYAELENRAEAATEYAKEKLMEDCGLEEDAVQSTDHRIQIADGETVFQIGLVYQPGEEKVNYKYGYDVKTDDDYNCTILAESREKGQAYAKNTEDILTMEKVERLLADRGHIWKNLTAEYTGEMISGGASTSEIVQYPVEDDYAVWITWR